MGIQQTREHILSRNLQASRRRKIQLQQMDYESGSSNDSHYGEPPERANVEMDRQIVGIRGIRVSTADDNINNDSENDNGNDSENDNNNDNENEEPEGDSESEARAETFETANPTTSPAVAVAAETNNDSIIDLTKDEPDEVEIVSTAGRSVGRCGAFLGARTTKNFSRNRKLYTRSRARDTSIVVIDDEKSESPPKRSRTTIRPLDQLSSSSFSTSTLATNYNTTTSTSTNTTVPSVPLRPALWPSTSRVEELESNSPGAIIIEDTPTPPPPPENLRMPTVRIVPLQFKTL